MVRVQCESQMFAIFSLNFILLVPIAAASKFVLSLTDPDFTVYKVEDPFKKLGPLAIFSAKRHWTVPRTVCLKKASTVQSIDSDIVINSSIRPDDFSSRSSNSSMSTNSSNASGGGMSVNNLSHRNNEFAEDFGFKLRGDSPVIISMVKPNSLADVSDIISLVEFFSIAKLTNFFLLTM